MGKEGKYGSCINNNCTTATWELHRVDITTDIWAKALRWAGHIARRQEGTLLRVCRETARKKTPPGRNLMRWWDQVKRDLERIGHGLNKQYVVPSFC